MLVVKLRRVLPRLAPASAAALGLVAAVLATGLVWSSAGRASLGGYSVLVWHGALGGALAALVLTHALARAKRPRRRDLADRRQFLTAAAVGAGALAAWQRAAPAPARARAAGRRAALHGLLRRGLVHRQRLPVDVMGLRPPAPALEPALRLAGGVRRELTLSAAELARGDELTATLDCTGGFSSTQRWRGVRLGRLLDEAGRAGRAPRHVRVISRTGYRWSFGLDDARGLLLATHVGDEPLAHGHGAPCRLVAPGPPRLPVGQVGGADRGPRGPRPGRDPLDRAQLVQRRGARAA